MAEIKRDFHLAKMSKDFDDRLVKKGDYRDALNIEIFTSETGSVGTAQNIKGNTQRTAMANEIWGVARSGYIIPDTATCVASVASLKTDKIYYFVSAGDIGSGYTSAPDIKKDYILEYDSVLETHKYVFTDIYQVDTQCSAATSSSDNYILVPSLAADNHPVLIDTLATNTTGIRIGMTLTGGGYNLNHNLEVTDIQTFSATSEGVETNYWKVFLNQDLTAFDISADASVSFHAPQRVLWFDKSRLITGINVLDDFIYWTDNETEPKKINIPRSIAGTGGLEYLDGAGFAGFASGAPTNSVFVGDSGYFHTRLVVGQGTDLKIATKSNNQKAVYVQPKHVTVIKKAPTQPLSLEMYQGGVPRIPNGSTTENDLYGYIPNLNVFEFITYGLPFQVGELLDGDNSITFSEAKDFRVGDILRLTPSEADTNFSFSDTYSIRVQIVAHELQADGPFDNPNTTQTNYNAVILSLKGNLTASQKSFKAVLEQGDSLFEFKFPRFSYRYKYQDGEYSTFAPWSEIAFLADMYSFSPSQGYNLGMTNQLRSLVLKGYHAGEDRMMEDVAEIDILYKATNDPTVYTVKTVTPNDNVPGVWPVSGNLEGTLEERGALAISTDLIHAVVPANQLLRPWDNVPRKALCQEISANRLIYGNYVQNYNVPVQPLVTAGVHSNPIGVESNKISTSVKSLRDYTLGVVFSDKYGRETPVLYSGDSNNSVKIPKESSTTKNKLTAFLSSSVDIPSWASYYSYYVKEPSVEYYNLIMDRWYPAEDGNLWLSFPSSERNKITEEDFLVLKKRNGSNLNAEGSSKYKIIDIKGEAPESIKKVKTELGRIFDDQTDNFVGGGGGGYILEDFTYFKIKKTVVLDKLGGNFNASTPNLSVIIKGNGHSSKEYELSSVIEDTPNTGGQNYTFYIKGKFGPDVAFATDFTGIYANRINNLIVQFNQYKQENKPEFAGRFFVKVNRDPDLEEYILGLSGASDFVVDLSWPFRYINNNWYINSEGQGALMPDNPVSIYRPNIFQDGTTMTHADIADNRHIHPTEYQYHFDNGGTNATRYYWGGHIGADADYEGGNGDEPGGLFGRSFRMDPIGALNDSDLESASNFAFQQQKPIVFWSNFSMKNSFFIDGASAYSWTSFNGFPQTIKGSFGSDNYFETPGVNPSGTNQSVVGGSNTSGTDVFGLDGFTFEGRANYHWASWITLYSQMPENNPYASDPLMVYYNSIYNSTEPHPTTGSAYDVGSVGHETSAMGFGASDNVAANMKQLHGLPSRAIRHTSYTDPVTNITKPASYFDFSYTFNAGTGQGGSIWDIEDDQIPQQISDAGVGVVQGNPAAGIQLVDIDAFAKRMVTPGTRFRFQRDPDAIVYTVKDYTDTSEGYGNSLFWKEGSNKYSGAFGIRNYRPDPRAGANFTSSGEVPSPLWQYRAFNTRQRWSIVTVPQIGSGPSGYNPIQGTKPAAQGGPVYADATYRRALTHDGTGTPDIIEILSVYNEEGTTFTPNAAVFETQPRESADLDIYYQASPLIPLNLTTETNEEFLPIGTTFLFKAQAGGGSAGIGSTEDVGGGGDVGLISYSSHTITGWSDKETIVFTPKLPETNVSTLAATLTVSGAIIKFTRPDGYQINSRLLETIGSVATSDNITTMKLWGAKQSPEVSAPPSAMIYAQKHFLNWNNCWVFGNGVESDRIRDDFNAAQMDNGVKASSTLATQVKEERRKHGLIWSGIYNSTSGINDTNQFIMAESITKDINPVYGSIQKLFTRDTRLTILCEDKILKAVTNKDALYNADGSSQLLARKTVVGDVTTYQGDFGISKNPESFVATPYQMYFTDAIRGQVLAMSMEGIRSISNTGMKQYFAELCKSNVWRSVGTYDERKSEYNVSILKKFYEYQTSYTGTTISYSELSKGWTSFKSFIPQGGLSINNRFYTFFNGHMWEHYSNDLYNNFYGEQYNSDITLILNDSPENVKSFGNINYEGSEAKISAFTDVDEVDMLSGVHGTNEGITVTNDVTGANPTGSTTLSHEFFNLTAQAGWYVDNITTDQQTCGTIEFKDKEGKYYGQIFGEETSLSNLDEKEFTVQGLGDASMNHSDSTLGDQIAITIANNTSTTYQGDSSTIGLTWDESAD